MIRLPDHYYTSVMLDGVNAQSSYKRDTIGFNAGDDIVLSVYLMFNGTPVNIEKHELRATLRKNKHAQNDLWIGLPHAGIFPVEGKPSNFVSIIIPSDISALLLPGTYHLAVRLTEKVGTGSGIRDITETLMETMFEVRRSANMPYAKLGGNTEINTYFDTASSQYKTRAVVAEETVPMPVPIIDALGGGVGSQAGQPVTQEMISVEPAIEDRLAYLEGQILALQNNDNVDEGRIDELEEEIAALESWLGELDVQPPPP